MGSVKDLTILEWPTMDEMGYGSFTFSDRYSVFDWGETPDHIPRKGAALCATSRYFFELAGDEGIKTHYVRQPSTKTNTMDINLVNVVMPKKIIKDGKAVYDYSMFQDNGMVNFLILNTSKTADFSRRMRYDVFEITSFTNPRL